MKETTPGLPDSMPDCLFTFLTPCLSSLAVALCITLKDVISGFSFNLHESQTYSFTDIFVSFPTISSSVSKATQLSPYEVITRRRAVKTAEEANHLMFDYYISQSF